MSYLTLKDQTQLYYNDWGQGAPVILIHGWPLNSDMWEYQTQALLEQGFRVIAYDRRGFGRSSQPLSGYDYDILAEDLHELITHLQLENPALVGFSMGGGEVARYLGRYGAKDISKAVLISSVVPYLLKTDSHPEGLPRAEFDKIVIGLKEDRPQFLAEFSKQFYGMGLLSSPVSEGVLNWTAFMAFQAFAKATVDCVTAFGTTDFRGDLQAFNLPTLIIHGTGDKVVPFAAGGEAAARGISDAVFKPYEGAPHGLFITHREQLNNDLATFLAQERTQVWKTPVVRKNSVARHSENQGYQH